MNIIINFSIYQTVWFLCVFMENIGALLSLPLIALHLLLSPDRRKDIHLMIILLGAGMLIDGILHMLGFISFNSPAYPIPLWLAVVWIALASLPHHSLKWLKGKPVLSAFFGCIGGPLAYYSGVKAGAAYFHLPLVPSLTVLALIWAMTWPAVMQYAHYVTSSGKMINQPKRVREKNEH